MLILYPHLVHQISWKRKSNKRKNFRNQNNNLFIAEEGSRVWWNLLICWTILSPVRRAATWRAGQEAEPTYYPSRPRLGERPEQSDKIHWTHNGQEWRFQNRSIKAAEKKTTLWIRECILRQALCWTVWTVDTLPVRVKFTPWSSISDKVRPSWALLGFGGGDTILHFNRKWQCPAWLELVP